MLHNSTFGSKQSPVPQSESQKQLQWQTLDSQCSFVCSKTEGWKKTFFEQEAFSHFEEVVTEFSVFVSQCLQGDGRFVCLSQMKQKRRRPTSTTPATTPTLATAPPVSTNRRSATSASSSGTAASRRTELCVAERADSRSNVEAA